MKIVNATTVVNEIIMEMDKYEILSHEDLNKTKLIFDMVLSQYQLSYEEETAISTELDQNEYFLEQFILDMKLRGCTDSSIKTYRCDLKNFLTFVDMPISYIKYANIQRYLANGKLNRKWKDRTYNAKLIEIRSFFAYLYEEDFISSNPGKKLHETKVEYKIGLTINAYQREEIKCSCKNDKEIALIEMLYSSGIRVNELCGLNISDLDFQNKSAIVYGKGRKEREIYFNDPAKFYLERYLKTRSDDNPALFVACRKPYNRLTTGSIRNMLKAIKSRDIEIRDIKLTPHVYRRSVGTDMINKGHH